MLPLPLPYSEPLATFSVTLPLLLRTVLASSASPWRRSICTASLAVMLFSVTMPV